MSRARPHRRAPRPLAGVLDRVAGELAPATVLARLQGCWAGAVGAPIAAEARPTGEAGGVLTITCSAAVWAHELEMMGPRLVEQLNAALGEPLLTGVRCRVG